MLQLGIVRSVTEIVFENFLHKRLQTGSFLNTKALRCHLIFYSLDFLKQLWVFRFQFSKPIEFTWDEIHGQVCKRNQVVPPWQCFEVEGVVAGEQNMTFKALIFGKGHMHFVKQFPCKRKAYQDDPWALNTISLLRSQKHTLWLNVAVKVVAGVKLC